MRRSVGDRGLRRGGRGAGGTKGGPGPFCCGARPKAGGAVLAEGRPFHPSVTFRSPRAREREGRQFEAGGPLRCETPHITLLSPRVFVPHPRNGRLGEATSPTARPARWGKAVMSPPLSSRPHAVFSINEQRAQPSSPQGRSAPGGVGVGVQFQAAGTWLTPGWRSQSPAGGPARGSPPQAGRRRRGRRLRRGRSAPVSPTPHPSAPHPALAPRTTFHRLGPCPHLPAAPGPGLRPRVWTPHPPALDRTPSRVPVPGSRPPNPSLPLTLRARTRTPASR